MELHSIYKTSNRSHLAEEKHQMLDLNKRLETYLSRVKHLEEENVLLAEEIAALRQRNHGASGHRKALEEELRHARLELDAAWREKVLSEYEFRSIAEEFQMLDQQRQREAQAHVEAKTMVEQSRKELEEEQRAQMWLRQKVSQLEYEIKLLIQNHQEEVTHVEATLAQSRATMPPILAHRGKHQSPDILQLRQELSLKATRAWEEAAGAYQGQLEKLEESLNQTMGRLAQVGQEKRESQLRLQALEKEITSAQDIRIHLEKSANQQREQHCQEIQQMKAHLHGLEAEREELGQQIDHLVMENRGLVQQKMSLGLEVATYRALLDSESLRRDVPLSKPLVNTSITDAAFCPPGQKTKYQTQFLTSHKTVSVSSHSALTAQAPTASFKTTPLYRQNPPTFYETPKTTRKPADEAPELVTVKSPYPKILQDGAVENFRPQEVEEKVTYAEPLSPPNEQEIPIGGEENQRSVDEEFPKETLVEEWVVSQQVESGLSREPCSSDEVNLTQLTAPNLQQKHEEMTEESHDFSAETHTDVVDQGPAEMEEVQKPHLPVEVEDYTVSLDKAVEHEQDKSSDSETEALLEPTPQSKTSSPTSEDEAGEVVFNQLACFNDSTGEVRQEVSPGVEPVQTDLEDKLYPDGEEMDTWDSVIEKKVDLKMDKGVKYEEAKTQHAEPEEDISAREKEQEQENVCEGDQKGDQMTEPEKEEQLQDNKHREIEAPPDHREDDEDEDSQNVSVSWRTELEGDSYAQDNTVADTRPLIRYKSDETDANTQASHMDESESSEGDQDRRMMGEPGSGMWGENKTKRFGTMEDLCEEGEAMDEEYGKEYTYVEERDVSQVAMAFSEPAASDTVTEGEGEIIKDVSEEYSDEETEEFIISRATPKVGYGYGEELDTDRLVEQELENLTTESYSAHFAQTQPMSESEEMLHLQAEVVEKMMNEPEQSDKTKAEDMSLTAEPAVQLFEEMSSTTTIIDQSRESMDIRDSQPLADEDRCAIDKINKDLEPVVPMSEDVKDIKTEEVPDFGNNLPDMGTVQDPDSVPQENQQREGAPSGDQEELHASESQAHLTDKDVEYPGVPETAEWDILGRECEEKHDSALDSSDDRGSDECVMMREEEPVESSPDTVPAGNDIFVDSSKLTNTENEKDTNFSGFWTSSLETGATYHTEEAYQEQTNQNLRFGENLEWENVENPNVVNGNSLVVKKEQEVKTGVKQVLTRIVVDHSEESEAEAESWSSGEEAV